MRRTDQKFAQIVQGVAGTNTLVPAVAGKVIVVESLFLLLGAAGTAKLQSAANDITGAMALAANGGLVLPAVAGSEGGWFRTNPGEALNITTTGGAANGGLTYRVEDV